MGPGFARLLLSRSAAYPFATNLSLVTVPIGLIAIIIGPEVSRAFSIVFHTQLVVYLWGVAMALGGLNVAWGIMRHTPSIERAGMFVLCVPLAFYGVFVIVGLGRGGLVTGPVFLVLAVSCLQRARIIARAAHAVHVLADAAEHAHGDMVALARLDEATLNVLNEVAHGSASVGAFSAIDQAGATVAAVLAAEEAAAAAAAGRADVDEAARPVPPGVGGG